MRTTIKLLFLPILALLFMTSCGKKEDPITIVDTTKPIYYVVCEGNFNGGNGDVCRFFADDNTIEVNSFKLKNGRHLGDVAQSVTKQNGKLYFVVNNSNKIEIAEAGTLAELGTITGLNLPRNMQFYSTNQAFVSCWGNGGELVKVDVNTKSVLGNIKTGAGPGEMVIENNRLFVANSGGFDVDSTISIINLTSMQVENTVKVGDIPISIAADKNGKIWVLCQGKGSWQGETASKIVVINSSTFQIEKTISLYSNKHPGQLRMNTEKDKVFIGGGFGFDGIFSMNITDASISSTPIVTGFFYGFNIEPTKNNIFCLDAGDFQSAGTLKIYSPAGQLIKSLAAGIGPNSLAF